MTGCVFCDRIDRGDCERVNSEVVTFEPLHPVTPGHVLVVPWKHVRDFTERPSLTGHVMAAAAEVAKEFGGPCNVITSAGADATQTVFHLHVHLVPRHSGDGLALPWTAPRGEPSEADHGSR